MAQTPNNNPLIPPPPPAPVAAPADHLLVHTMLHSLVDTQLQTYTNEQQLFFYTDIIINVCKRLGALCAGSRVAMEAWCAYLGDRLVSRELDVGEGQGQGDRLMGRLRVQEKVVFLSYLQYVVYFTQICYRLVLLAYLVKLGKHTQHKQWKILLPELMKEAQLEMMFNYHDSLATCLVAFVDKMEGVCGEFVFYEKLVKLFQRYDLQYAAASCKEKLRKLKENWKAAMEKNKVQFKSSKTKSDENEDKDNKTGRKVVAMTEQRPKKARIALEKTPRPTPDQNIKQRISDFRGLERKRLSIHYQSGTKRTIFHSRKYTHKSSQSQSQQEQQSVYIEQEQDRKKEEDDPNINIKMELVIKEESVQVRSIRETRFADGNVIKNIEELKETYETRNARQLCKEKPPRTMEKLEQNDESFMARGTPPRKPPKTPSKTL